MKEYPKVVYPFGMSESGVYPAGEEPIVVRNAQEEDAVMDVRPVDLIPKRGPGRPKKVD